MCTLSVVRYVYADNENDVALIDFKDEEEPLSRYGNRVLIGSTSEVLVAVEKAAWFADAERLISLYRSGQMPEPSVKAVRVRRRNPAPQGWIADHFGVMQQTVSRWLSGSTTPDLDSPRWRLAVELAKKSQTYSDADKAIKRRELAEFNRNRR